MKIYIRVVVFFIFLNQNFEIVSGSNSNVNKKGKNTTCGQKCATCCKPRGNTGQNGNRGKKEDTGNTEQVITGEIPKKTDEILKKTDEKDKEKEIKKLENQSPDLLKEDLSKIHFQNILNNNTLTQETDNGNKLQEKQNNITLAEIQKQIELENKIKLEEEKAKQIELERQKQIKLEEEARKLEEKENQRKLEEQNRINLEEIQKQIELEKQKQKEAEEKRKQELERQKQIKLEEERQKIEKIKESIGTTKNWFFLHKEINNLEKKLGKIELFINSNKNVNINDIGKKIEDIQNQVNEIIKKSQDLNKISNEIENLDQKITKQINNYKSNTNFTEILSDLTKQKDKVNKAYSDLKKNENVNINDLKNIANELKDIKNIIQKKIQEEEKRIQEDKEKQIQKDKKNDETKIKEDKANKEKEIQKQKEAIENKKKELLERISENTKTENQSKFGVFLDDINNLRNQLIEIQIPYYNADNKKFSDIKKQLDNIEGQLNNIENELNNIEEQAETRYKIITEIENLFKEIDNIKYYDDNQLGKERKDLGNKFEYLPFKRVNDEANILNDLKDKLTSLKDKKRKAQQEKEKNKKIENELEERKNNLYSWIQGLKEGKDNKNKIYKSFSVQLSKLRDNSLNMHISANKCDDIIKKCDNIKNKVDEIIKKSNDIYQIDSEIEQLENGIKKIKLDYDENIDKEESTLIGKLHCIEEKSVNPEDFENIKQKLIEFKSKKEELKKEEEERKNKKKEISDIIDELKNCTTFIHIRYKGCKLSCTLDEINIKDHKDHLKKMNDLEKLEVEVKKIADRLQSLNAKKQQIDNLLKEISTLTYNDTIHTKDGYTTEFKQKMLKLEIKKDKLKAKYYDINGLGKKDCDNIDNIGEELKEIKSEIEKENKNEIERKKKEKEKEEEKKRVQEEEKRKKEDLEEKCNKLKSTILNYINSSNGKLSKVNDGSTEYTKLKEELSDISQKEDRIKAIFEYDNNTKKWVEDKNNEDFKTINSVDGFIESQNKKKVEDLKKLEENLGALKKKMEEFTTNTDIIIPEHIKTGKFYIKKINKFIDESEQKIKKMNNSIRSNNASDIEFTEITKCNTGISGAYENLYMDRYYAIHSNILGLKTKCVYIYLTINNQNSNYFIRHYNDYIKQFKTLIDAIEKLFIHIESKENKNIDDNEYADICKQFKEYKNIIEQLDNDEKIIFSKINKDLKENLKKFIIEYNINKTLINNYNKNNPQDKIIDINDEFTITSNFFNGVYNYIFNTDNVKDNNKEMKIKIKDLVDNKNSTIPDKFLQSFGRKIKEIEDGINKAKNPQTKNIPQKVQYNNILPQQVQYNNILPQQGGYLPYGVQYQQQQYVGPYPQPQVVPYPLQSIYPPNVIMYPQQVQVQQQPQLQPQVQVQQQQQRGK